MQKIFFMAALVSCTSAGFAQKQSGSLHYNKEKLDSLFRSLPKLNQPFAAPVPKGFVLPEGGSVQNANNFETANPGATVVDKTSRGTIYNIPLDNMAVLVPNMRETEKMPGSGSFKIAPRTKMPNPYYRGNGSPPKPGNK
jgi:hypothetical protein